MPAVGATKEEAVAFRTDQAVMASDGAPGLLEPRARGSKRLPRADLERFGLMESFRQHFGQHEIHPRSLAR
jgi:hypothetical protein